VPSWGIDGLIWEIRVKRYATLEMSIMARPNQKWFHFFIMISVIFAITLLSSIGYFVLLFQYSKNIDLRIEGDPIIANDDVIGFPMQKALHPWINDIIWGVKITWFHSTKSNMATYSNTEESRFKSLNFLMKRMIELVKNINAVLIVVHIPYFEQ
jgi:hypothetical protein